jgi:DNA-binding PadR family transcriptional regulator
VSRIFRRGELQAAVLDVLRADAPATGYAVMQALATKIGGNWRPSPGAVYPAMLGLEDAGLIVGRDVDGTRAYELSDAGRRAASTNGGVLDEVATRAGRARRTEVEQLTLGELVDRFAAALPGRSRALDPSEVELLAARLTDLREDLDLLLEPRSTS